jgi:hypothetical protein
MTIVQTVLVYIGIPVAVLALVVFAVYGRSMVHQPNRYRPGKAWTYPPAWYLPHPDAIADVVPDRVMIDSPDGAKSSAVAVGGANGEW